MIEAFQKWTDESQKMSKDGFDAALRSYGELNKGFQAITAKLTDYSKRAFEDATRAFEQLVGSKSIEQAIEIQSQYAKKAYDTWVAEASKLSGTGPSGSFFCAPIYGCRSADSRTAWRTPQVRVSSSAMSVSGRFC
jgi:phasin protein